MQVPLEVLEMIIAGLSKRDLKSSRLVCRKWDALIPRFLFDTVFLMARYADMEVADLVMEKYGQHVETLIVSAECFFFNHSDNYAQFGEDYNATVVNGVPECYPYHVKQHWEVYMKLAAEETVICHGELMFGQLCRAFTSLTRISRVVITHSWRKRENCWCHQAATDAQRRSYKPWKPAKACPRIGCRASDYHKDRCSTSLPERCNPNAPHKTWAWLMQAIDKNGKALQEIAVESGDWPAEHPNALPVSVFDQTFGLISIMSTVFKNLTKLELTLDVEEVVNSSGWPWDQEFHQVLSSAMNLRYLHIGLTLDSFEGVNPWDDTDFHALFKNKSFPRLETLSLERVSSTGPELVRFLQNSPIQCLMLKWFSLRVGYWSEVVHAIRDHTKVKELRLEALAGDLTHDVELSSFDDSVESCNLTSKLLEFFHHDEGTFFSLEELKETLTPLDEAESMGTQSDDEDPNDGGRTDESLDESLDKSVDEELLDEEHESNSDLG